MREQVVGPTREAPSGDVPPAVEIRSFRPSDASVVVDLIARSWTRDVVTEQWFTNSVLLDHRFDPRGLLIAERAGMPVGSAYAVAASESGQGVPAGSGWIPFIVVDPPSRRAGVGTLLLDAATSYLRGRGMESVTVGAYPPAYVIPGIDLESEDDARPLFAGAGFTIVEEPVGMRIELAGRTHNDVEVTERAIADGFRFRPCSSGDVPRLVTFAAAIGSDWGDVVRESILRHGDLERFQLAFAPDGSMAGFATFGSYEGDMTRFGPFGVDPDRRGASLGRILLGRTLTAMQSRGASQAWFLWTDPTGAAGRLYERVGFTAFRRFAIFRKSLLQTPSIRHP
jgi:mycothiol synthase